MMRTAMWVLLALAMQLGTGADVSAACTGDCPAHGVADDASLVQLRKESDAHAQEFPDLGAKLKKAADYIRGFAGGAEDAVTQAADALSNATAVALVVLGNTLNKTLAVLAAEAKDLQMKVSASKANLTSGVASTLGRTLGVNITAVPVGRQYEVVVNSTLGTAGLVWKAVATAVQAVLSALVQGLDSVGLSATIATFNSTMQVVLANTSDFAASLESLRDSLSGRDSKSVHNLIMPDEGLSEKLNDTLQVAESYAAAFPNAFTGAFSSLQDEVINGTTSMLRADALSRVRVAFEGAQGQAEVAAAVLSNASSQLIESIRAGLSVAHPQPVQRAAARFCSASPVVLTVLMLPVLFALPLTTAPGA